MRFARLRGRMGLDSHVLGTLLYRGWTTVAGAVTTALIPFWLRPDEQGYYYTLLSLLMLQVFFELGLNQIIVQLVSHEVSLLRLRVDGGYEGEGERLNRLSGILSLIRQLYLVPAINFMVLAGGGGTLFFLSRAAVPPTRVLLIWIILVTLNAVILYASPWLAVLEGCGQVDRVARLRLRQAMVGSALAFGGFASGIGLWAVLMPSLVAMLGTVRFVLGKNATVSWLRSRPRIRGTFDYRRDVLPLQWRYALSWISGYFILQTFVPIVFARLGPISAGRIGITLAVFSSLQTLGMSWIVAKAPAFTALIARGEGAELRALFRLTGSRALLFVSFGACAGLLILARLPPNYAVRFASLEVAGCIAAATIINTVIFAATFFMRAHRREPLVWMSVLLATLVAPSVFVTAQYGLLAPTAVYLLLNASVGLPWALIVFKRYWAVYKPPGQVQR